jgi:MYXO-CTERM domain-containing protein
VYDAICGLCRNSLGDPKLITTSVATNVKPGCTPKKAAADCWHVASGDGLPHVAISGIAIDPDDTRTIYVTMNENSLIGLDQSVVGAQRVMVSHNAGESFTDLTGNLPRSNARDVVVRDGQLIVATDNGVFTAPRTGLRWSRLATGLPQTRIFDLSLDRTGRYLTVAAYGRGVWVLDFQSKAVTSSAGPKPGEQVGTGSGTGNGNLAATGSDSRLPWLALPLLALALVIRRRRRA